MARALLDTSVTASAQGVPLMTFNVDYFRIIDDLVDVRRPELPPTAP